VAVFGAFCSTSGCPPPALVTYYITLTDVYGDGWTKNVLAFRQNGTVTPFGSQFTTGKVYGPIALDFKPGVYTDVIIYTLGTYIQ